jgi:spermidine synthase
MAILWSKIIDGKKYEVRAAGKTRRLYTDGVFHSQYHPDRLYAGSIWDLLMLPALFYEPGQLKRILVLGAGGGAVIHLLQRYAQPEVIDAIDLNPVHLQIARRFFDVTPSVANLVEADGVEWLNNYNGPLYDMIIDDMFGEENGEPARAVDLDHRWIATLRKKLSKNGVLVLNTLISKNLRQAACFTNRQLSRSFKSAYQLQDPDYYNAIGAVFRQPMNTRYFYKRLKAFPSKNRLNIRISRIK